MKDANSQNKSHVFKWFWSQTHKEWNLRSAHNAPSLATVFNTGIWITWDFDSNADEMSSSATVDEAKLAAFEAAIGAHACSA